LVFCTALFVHNGLILDDMTLFTAGRLTPRLCKGGLCFPLKRKVLSNVSKIYHPP
jgi:hypothetical protein